jgi:hypothetical protein
MRSTSGRLLAERERFELSRGITSPYRFSKPAPSASWVPLLNFKTAFYQFSDSHANQLVPSCKPRREVCLQLGKRGFVRKLESIHWMAAEVQNELAEGVGFEPTDPLPGLLFSRQVHSSTMRPLPKPMIQYSL